MPAESARRPVVMLSAGEASGDLHGGALAAALRRLAPEARLFGMGGERMASAGVELLADARDMAVVGFTEAVRRLPHLRHTLAELRKALRSQRPDVLVTIDYPGFNLRLAEVARDAGIPVVYFVPPQIWAWRAGRIRDRKSTRLNSSHDQISYAVFCLKKKKTAIKKVKTQVLTA